MNYHKVVCLTMNESETIKQCNFNIKAEISRTTEDAMPVYDDIKKKKRVLEPYKI